MGNVDRSNNVIEESEISGNNRTIINKYSIGTVIGLVIFPILLDKLVFGNKITSNLTNGEWSSFLGSYFGGLFGGILSVAGVFLTLRYYRNKDSIEAEKTAKVALEEKEWRENTRILGIRPYLRILRVKNGDGDQLRKVELQFTKVGDQILNTGRMYHFVLCNDGLGVALHIECAEIAGTTQITEKKNISLAVNERYYFQIALNATAEIPDITKIRFIFNDIFDNKYEQTVGILYHVSSGFTDVESICAPKLLVKDDKHV